MGPLLQDLRYAVRMLSRKPGFSLTAILTLGLGIGINTAMFCIVNSVLIEPLPFRDSDRLVMLWENNLKTGRKQERISPPNFADWRNQNQAFEQMAAFAATNFTLTGMGEPEKIKGALVSINLFQMLGVQPMLGRDFLPNEEQPGQDEVIILSHGLWQRYFGSELNIADKTLTLDNKSYRVVGVMPDGFHFPEWLQPSDSKSVEKAQMWAPLSFSPGDLAIRGGRYLGAIARLKPDVTLAEAKTELETIALRLEESYPENKGYSVTIVPIYDQVIGGMKSAFFILLGAVGFILLIACANVANLLLALATTRQKEMAIRLALGSSRSRLIRQLLTESTLLSICGGIVGVLLAYWWIQLFVASISEIIPRGREITIDVRVLVFTLAISLLTGLAFGAVPALQASKPNINEYLKEGRRSLVGSFSHNRARSLFIVFEVASSLVLLIGAGLMIRSFVRLVSTPPGFDPENVIAMRITLPQSMYQRNDQKVGFFQQLVSRTESLPGVRSAALTTNLPLSGTSMMFSFKIESGDSGPGENKPVQYHAVSPNYFQTMKIPILSGRSFTERDTENAPAVIIVNETLAQRFFNDEDPVGKRIKVTYGKGDREIIGVVENVKHSGLESDSFPEVYVPYLQNPWASMTIVARTDSDLKLIASALKNEVWALDKQQPIDSINTVEGLLSNSVSRPRIYTVLLGLFAALAMALAVVGIYGLVSYSITQRTHEIGIRMALGARQRDVITLLVSQGLILSLTGIAIGLAAAFLLTRLMSSLLYGVSPTDSFTYIVISVLLIAVTLIASYIPARRATKIDPVVALRYE